MLHAERSDGPIAAAQNCATHGPLSVATRGRRCTAWSSMRRFDWRLSTRGLSHHEAGPSVRDRPPHGEEDAELFVAAGIPPDEAGAAAQAGRVHRHRRRDPGGGRGSGRAAQAAPHGASDLRAVARRARIHGRVYDREGLCPGPAAVVREAFVPLHHPPGHAQVDFGEAVVELRGQREKIAFFCLILPHSNVWFVKAYPRETTEAFLDGHVSAFAFLGGVPRSILHDKTKQQLSARWTSGSVWGRTWSTG